VKAVTNATYGCNSAGCITNITYTGANYGWTNAIAWNQQYQITSFTTNGATAETFAYDALGRRVRRRLSGSNLENRKLAAPTLGRHDRGQTEE